MRGLCPGTEVNLTHSAAAARPATLVDSVITPTLMSRLQRANCLIQVQLMAFSRPMRNRRERVRQQPMQLWYLLRFNHRCCNCILLPMQLCSGRVALWPHILGAYTAECTMLESAAFEPGKADARSMDECLSVPAKIPASAVNRTQTSIAEDAYVCTCTSGFDGTTGD